MRACACVCMRVAQFEKGESLFAFFSFFPTLFGYLVCPAWNWNPPFHNIIQHFCLANKKATLVTTELRTHSITGLSSQCSPFYSNFILIFSRSEKKARCRFIRTYSRGCISLKCVIDIIDLRSKFYTLTLILCRRIIQFTQD